MTLIADLGGMDGLLRASAPILVKGLTHAISR